MGWVADLFGGSAAAPIEATGRALDGLFTSDDERLTHAEVMERLRQQPGAAQVQVNLAEAAHRSLWVAGWRPAVGWVCVAGLANVFLVNPWLQWVTGAPGPAIPIEAMYNLVLALLGLGAMRTVEKARGVSQ